MTIYALTLVCPDAVLAERIAGTLEPVSAAVSYFEGHGAARDVPPAWEVSAYFDGPPDEAAVRAAIDAAGDAELASAATFEALPETDWVAQSQRMLAPVQAGGFTIHGAHDRETVDAGDDTIEIDAGGAFGTAHHGTTTGCLEAIDALSRRFPYGAIVNILDLGTGSAILAIAAHRRWPTADVLATDIDPVAIDIAKRNAKLNSAGASIRFAVADGLADDNIAGRAPYDLIVANILAGPLTALAGDLCGALSTDAHARIILSGLLDDQAENVVLAYRHCGLVPEAQISGEGWSTLTLRAADPSGTP